jgi:hypothetical protein
VDQPALRREQRVGWDFEIIKISSVSGIRRAGRASRYSGKGTIDHVYSGGADGEVPEIATLLAILALVAGCPSAPTPAAPFGFHSAFGMSISFRTPSKAALAATGTRW